MLALVPRLRAVLVGCCLLLSCSAASANMAAPRWQGDLVVEPKGIKEVAIVHEELTIDLRPLADLEPARVEVAYRLHNPKAARRLELVFVSGAVGVRDFEVRLGSAKGEGRFIPTNTILRNGSTFPESWRPRSKDVPAFDRDIGPAYWTNTKDEWPLLTFTVDLPRGPSTLMVRYRARASGGDEEEPVTTWVFPYVLAPARDWGSFGGLDVTVHLPERWEAKSSPGLTREGDVLHGNFQEVPADCLVVVARAPLGPRLRRTKWLCGGLLALSLVLGGALCWWVGRWKGRYPPRITEASPDQRGQLAFSPAELASSLLALLMPIVWPAMILGVLLLTRWEVYRVVGQQEAPFLRRYTTELPVGMLACGGVCLVLAVFPVGILLTVAGLRRSRSV
jgi:hypothetical protein